MAPMVAVVKEQGVLQDIVVTPLEGGKYQIVFGERRYRAALAAGIQEMRVKVESLSEVERLEAQLTENIQRVDLNVRDRANALARYVALQPDQKTAATRLALSEARISQLLELTQLCPELEELSGSNVVRDTSTLIMANKLLKVAPEKAAELFREATANGKLPRAKVAAAMAPYVKHRSKKAASPPIDDSDVSLAPADASSESSPPSSATNEVSLHQTPARIHTQSIQEQVALPGFEKVSLGKVDRVKKLLAIDRDIPTDELVAMLVDAYLASTELMAAA